VKGRPFRSTVPVGFPLALPAGGAATVMFASTRYWLPAGAFTSSGTRYVPAFVYVCPVKWGGVPLPCSVLPSPSTICQLSGAAGSLRSVWKETLSGSVPVVGVGVNATGCVAPVLAVTSAEAEKWATSGVNGGDG
jgi:hypothetical protein